ncbi:uncharacterized protein JCM10292_005305 [Rhodotorula paludigena]|uniref:uncharacterized protein n=1 Tax=Rhodotorula paludigena TaxID=86838 RepID=UPI0031797578
MLSIPSRSSSTSFNTTLSRFYGQHNDPIIQSVSSFSARDRPLSVASTLSAASIASSASATSSAYAYPYEQRRRSAVLRDIDVDVDNTTRSSLLRAEEVLRASEIERERERRRSRLSWRERQSSRSYFVKDLVDAAPTHERDLQLQSVGIRSALQRFSPKRLLRKTQSIPTDILLSSPRAESHTATPTLNGPVISSPRRIVKSPSPPRPAAPRRAASAANLLSTQATVVKQSGSIARPASPPPHRHYGTLPLRFSHLPVPTAEPPSKFSGSSGDSLVNIVTFDGGAVNNKRRPRLKDRARTFSQASTSGLKTLKSRVGKSGSTRNKGVKRKTSLANLFSGIGGGASDDSSGASGPSKAPSASTTSTRLPPSSSDASGHRPSTSISSYAPSSSATTASDSAPAPHRKPSRLGFFRSTIKRDSTGAASNKRNSIRTRSSGQVSPSLISRPVSISASDGLASAHLDKRFSGVTSSSDGSAPVSVADKKGWASRISRVVKGKNVAAKKALFETGAVVQRAEKVRVPPAGSPDVTAHPPSRRPLATLFSHPSAPARPPRPSKNPESSDDTTFYGHRIPAVKSRAAAIDARAIRSTAPRVRPKASAPVCGKPLLLASMHQASSWPKAPHESVAFATSSAAALLPAAPIYPASAYLDRPSRPDSFDSSDSSLSPVEHTSPSFLSSSDEELRRCASPFRSPSPARFRDLMPSLPAGSSPEKNERGLPVPQGDSPQSARSRDSPKKRAMGPEQIILMEDTRQTLGPTADVRGATTDLADLLSGLEETSELQTANVGDESFSPRHYVAHQVSDLSASLRSQLPHSDSIESLRSSVSDVPHDLKQLISAVNDHISEVDVPPVYIESASMGARGFADELAGSSSSSDSSDSDDELVVDSSVPSEKPTSGFLAVIGENTTAGFSKFGGLTANFDATGSTFEGHFSTAAAALRSMLTGPDPPVTSPTASATLQAFPPPASATLLAFQLREVEEEPTRDEERDSLRDALALGRPSHGDKMFDRVDEQVSLAALVHSPSPPESPEDAFARARETAFLLNHLRTSSIISSSEEGSAESQFSLMASPTPLPLSGRRLRQSLARYSQDRFPTRRPSHRARPVSAQSSLSSEHDSADKEATSMSLAISSRSTNLSISSLTSSPCPAPQHRRIPMLTRQLPPPTQPAFRFPPPVKAQGATGDWAGQAVGEALIDSRNHADSAVPLDTPPPSSSDSGRSPLDENAPLESLVDGAGALRGPHARRTSRQSTNLPILIAEEEEGSPPRLQSVGGRFQLLSPVAEPPSPQVLPRSPSLDSQAVEVVLSELGQSAHVIELEVPDDEDDFEFTAETNLEATGCRFAYEAETEIKRSRVLWPDTDFSREVLEHFLLPRTYHAILEFLFYSQNRFPSPAHLHMDSLIPSAFDDPPTPPSPIRIPSPIVDSPIEYEHAEPEAIAPFVVPAKPLKAATVPRKTLGPKSVNRMAAALSQSASSSVQPHKEDSPFTALPPRLSSKWRGMRGKVVSKSPKKVVDTGFLGDSATTRRQGQFNAAMRRLEGVGAPSEQRSDEETDDTGVLEAKGEATEELTFSKASAAAAILFAWYKV